VTGRADGKTLELVVFTLKEGTTREQFLATNDAVSDWIRRQPGFISHELSYAADGDRWIEVAWWKSLEDAEDAASAAMSSPSCAPMFRLIDMESALMLHGEPAISPVLAQRAADDA
jgi:antibiotic biosynthesis monooxygenase (ABM) superfamily enzyme